MRVVAKQVEIGGLESERDELLSIKAGKVWRTELWAAIKLFVLGYIDAETGLKGYDGCAYRLNLRWGEEGRHVTAGSLRAALETSERNNFRLEWAYWFAEQSADIADLLGRHVKPTKTAEEMNADIIAVMRELLGHKLVEQILRGAKAR